MSEPHSFDDAVLGSIEWKIDAERWDFSLVLPDGQTVTASINPDDRKKQISEGDLKEIRACIARVSSHELDIRRRITDQMFPPWEESIKTADEFIDKLRLDGINFYGDNIAECVYDDGGLFWGHAIVIDVDQYGEYRYEPQLSG